VIFGSGRKQVECPLQDDIQASYFAMSSVPAPHSTNQESQNRKRDAT